MDAPPPPPLRQRPPGRVHDRRGGDGGVRARPAPRSPASQRARRRARSCSPKNVTEAMNLVAYSWARCEPRCRRRDRPHRDGAPRQRRAVAHARRRARHRAALDPAHRTYAARPHPPRRAPRRREAARGHRDVERARHDQRHPAARRSGARRRRARARRRRPGGPPPAVDVQALGRRLRRLHRPQDARPHRHRRPVGPRGAARGDAAVPRRRRDDPRRPRRRVHHERAAVEVRGRHDADRRGESGSAPRSTTCRASGMDAVRAHELELTGYALRHARGALRGTALDLRARPTSTRRGGAISFLFDGHPRARHLAGARRGRRVRPGGPPLRQAPDAGAGRARHHPGLLLRLQRRSPTSTPS